MTPIIKNRCFDCESFQIVARQDLVATIEGTIRSFLPQVRFGSGPILRVETSWSGGKNQRFLMVKVDLNGETAWSHVDEEIFDSCYNVHDRQRRVKERVRLGILRVLEQANYLFPRSWGILTGVRPTKLVHSLLDRGFSQEKITTMLGDVYALSPKKTGLLLDVVDRQRGFFHPSPNQPVSVYIGIPFCPTRCSYCSFAAYPLHSHGHLLAGFLQALRQEIRSVGALLRELAIIVEAVYLGGGTPTILRGDDLKQLLDLVVAEFGSENLELTVEAGRPETLSFETLKILKNAQTKRISINPQTMQEATLKQIGRAHSVQDVYHAFDQTRQLGIPIINMDIILGLPGEKSEDVKATLECLADLGPDNLTVHSLAPKRAATAKHLVQLTKMAQREGEAMADLTEQFAVNWGMAPYYLYRQRHIFANLENVGYAKPGLESRYNIQMMEERQTIIALGGGGITKLVSPDLTLIRMVNPKCPATYSRYLEEGLVAKIDQIRKHLSV